MTINCLTCVSTCTWLEISIVKSYLITQSLTNPGASSNTRSSSATGFGGSTLLTPGMCCAGNADAPPPGIAAVADVVAVVGVAEVASVLVAAGVAAAEGAVVAFVAGGGPGLLGSGFSTPYIRGKWLKTVTILHGLAFLSSSDKINY